MMKLSFFLPMLPPTVTAQEHQVSCVKGKPVFYDPPELKTAKAKLAAHLSRHIPERSFTGALRVIVKWCFPVVGKHKDGEYKTTKPDISNLQKALEDVMEDLNFYSNDALIVSLIVEKFYSSIPGIFILIEEIKQ